MCTTSYALALALTSLAISDILPVDYEKAILKARQEEAQDIGAPTSWLSLVALAPLTIGEVSVGSAPSNTVPLEHGLSKAFTLHVAAGKITLAAVDPAVTVNGRHPHIGDSIATSEDDKATLHWGDLWARVIERTGNQTYLRVGDPNSPNRRHFHGLNFYPVNSAYRITAKWVPYKPPHEIHMGTVLGTTLASQAAGYAEFTLNGQTVRIDGEEISNGQVSFSFRDGTAKTSTYGAGRQILAERPSKGTKLPGTLVIDFNMAINWPCAYTEYGTCPLPPKQNRFDTPIPAGEKRYHE